MRHWIARVTLGGGLMLLVGGGAVAATNYLPRTTPSTAHGSNFQIKSAVDFSFCIDVPAGATPGRKLTLTACSPANTERWAFTENSDGTNLLIDDQGFCVDSVGRKAGDGISLQVLKCSFVKSQRFRYNSIGQMQFFETTNCVSLPRANAAAALFLEKCDSSKKRQQFKLAQ